MTKSRWFLSVVWNLFADQLKSTDVCMRADVSWMILSVSVRMHLLWVKLAEELTMLTRILLLDTALLLILCCLTMICQSSNEIMISSFYELFCESWWVYENVNEEEIEKCAFAEWFLLITIVNFLNLIA